jgi:hypothetical protein
MDTVNYTILASNLEGNSIIVRPYSPDFKYSPEEYQPVNINFTNLDPNQDVYAQIAAYMQPLIQSILVHETDKGDYTTVAAQLSTVSPLQLQTVSVSSIQSLTSANTQLNDALMSISTPTTALQVHVDFVTNFQLQDTFSGMMSATLLDGIEFVA